MGHSSHHVHPRPWSEWSVIPGQSRAPPSVNSKRGYLGVLAWRSQPSCSSTQSHSPPAPLLHPPITQASHSHDFMVLVHPQAGPSLSHFPLTLIYSIPRAIKCLPFLEVMPGESGQKTHHPEGPGPQSLLPQGVPSPSPKTSRVGGFIRQLDINQVVFPGLLQSPHLKKRPSSACIPTDLSWNLLL